MLSSLVQAVLISWIAVAIALFALLPARRALIAGILAATMFLPMGMVEIHFVPGDKSVFTAVGLFLGGLIISPRPLLAFRPKWIDLPMIGYLVVPAISAAANGKDIYTAAADVAAEFCNWGLPYLLGRAYLTDLRALWEMACGLFIAGLVYAPFCIYEIIMSPQLHKLLYGFHQHPDWSQTLRWGGYRPMVFMQHGIMVSTFICAAALVGTWLWWSGALRSLFLIPSWLLTLFLAALGVMSKSTGPVALMVVAVVALFASRLLRRGMLAFVLAAVPFAYVVARTVGGWNGASAVELARHINPDNAASLEIRLDNENLIVERAMQKPWFGHGRGSEFLENTTDRPAIPDGMWVIALGVGGVAGLATLFAALIVPAVVLLWRFPAASWNHPTIAAAAVLAMFLIIFAIDCLMNAMINPAYLVALGGVAAVAVAKNPMPVKNLKSEI